MAALLAIALTLPATASAELSNDTLLGPGFLNQPVYDGSASRWTQFVPIVRYLGSPWFVRSTLDILEGGLRWDLGSGLAIGAQVAYEPGRPPDQSSFLMNHQVPGIDPGTSLGVHLEWDKTLGPMPISLLARSRTRVDPDLGSQIDLRASAGIFQYGPFSAGVFAQETWASAKWTNAFYGISQQQSAITGLRQYSPGSGWLYLSLGFQWQYDLTRNWVMVGTVENHQLNGDASHSPLTERSSNSYISAGLAYRF